MTDFSTEGILLKRVEYNDHDLIVTFFTSSCGRLSVIAKNARKSVRRFGGALDPFSVMTLQCRRSKRKEALPVLMSVDLSNPFARIRTDFVKTGYASYWIELVNSWMDEGSRQHDLFELLHYVLDALNSGQIETEVLSLLFQIRFMSISGFAPGLTQCGICSTPLDSIAQRRVLFEAAQGRLVCDRCRGAVTGNGMVVSKGTLKQLSWMNTVDFRRAERIRFSGPAIMEGERLLESFIPCHIGRTMNSLIFLNRIRKHP